MDHSVTEAGHSVQLNHKANRNVLFWDVLMALAESVKDHYNAMNYHFRWTLFFIFLAVIYELRVPKDYYNAIE